MSAIKRIIDKTWYGAEPRKAICDAAAGEYLALKEAESQRDTLRAELAQVQVDLTAKDSLLLEMFQALAGVLGDHEHRGAIRPTTLEACHSAVTHFVEEHTEPMR